MQNSILKLASLASLSLAFAACQPNADLVSKEPSSTTSNLVRFGGGQAGARAGAQSYIVTLKEDAAFAAILPQVAADYDEQVDAMRDIIRTRVSPALVSRLTQVYAATIKGFAVDLTDEEVAFLSNLPIVESIEADKIVSLGVPQTQVVAQAAQETPWGIDRVGGFVNYTGTAKAWIIDTGIDMTHPDLNVDQTNGKNFVNTGRKPNDDNGHGSHVAGTIAAKNNTIGVVGVAAGAKVVPVKVLNFLGFGSNSGVVKGIDYVGSKAKAGDVANMSLGGGISTATDNAVIKAANKGIRFCLAAGNDGANANNSSPARVNGPNIYTISAIDNTDTFASFSNFGNPPVDYAAPGVNVKSTYSNGGYATLSGTSMATPHAAGVLLVTGNAPQTSGFAIGDPDGTPDPIIHR